MHLTARQDQGTMLPGWLPQPVQHYLIHTEGGLSIRAVARMAGCNPSTVSRQVRKLELRRDDPLVDEGLRRIGRAHFNEAQAPIQTQDVAMKYAPINHPDAANSDAPSEAEIARQGLRVLRHLSASGAVLAVARDMDKAVIVRDGPGQTATKTAVVDSQIAQALALKEWIDCENPEARIARYRITSVGRKALKRMVAATESRAAGFHEDQSAFAGQHRSWGERDVIDDGETRSRRMRYNLAESPLSALARRKDKGGNQFLSDDLVVAGERLREDFELAQMGPRVAQNWERFLTGGHSGGFSSSDSVGGPEAARGRVQEALSELGPGLGDVVLRCCCFLEGLEAAEKRMGWSARSGKIVLRIALERLKTHYDARHGKFGPMIG